MLGNDKRKGRWSSLSLFGWRASNKVVILERPGDFGDNVDASQPSTIMSVDGQSRKGRRLKPGAAAKFRRSGSKVLSVLGLGGSSGSQANKSISSIPSERDVALAIVRDAVIPPVTSGNRLQGHSGLKPLQIPTGKRTATPIAFEVLEVQALLNVDQQTPQPSAFNNHRPLRELQQPQLAGFQFPPKRKDPAGLRQSRSMPGLAHQLSHKLSSTFGNPTIVHRPNLRTRPSLDAIRGEPTSAITSPNQEFSPQVDTDPSSYYNSGSVSPGDRSTGKTSLESNIASLRPQRPKDRSDNVPATEEKPQEKPLTPIPELAVVIKPTIVTVETTANAKIFFETHFNSILSGQASPRSQRRHELEARLHSEPLSLEQRELERHIWAKQESDYLRQSRVLKTKTNNISGSKGVSVAGYEVVRILGKGSFGVVRLVREKSIDQNDVSHPSKTPAAAIPPRRQTPREELNSLRMTAIDALKSATQQRDLKKTRRKVFAMKVIRKSDMLRNSQEAHLRAERDFLVASEKSRWVVPLVASFQDTTNLYLVMEYMIGGDFLGLLIREDKLKEKKARWYIAEMILCVEEAHRLRWIHRDVKPDNFLISASGHLKISDFGLAFDGHWAHDQSYFNNHRYSLMEKLGIEVGGDSIDRDEDIKKDGGRKLAAVIMGGKARHEKPTFKHPFGHESILQWRNRHGKRKLAKSVVGTSQYMAPEVIRGEPYDGRCDWWSVGIIMYECLYGRTPFVCEERQETKEKILRHETELKFPSNKEGDKKYKVSYEAMDLIDCILREKEHRLCSKKYMLNDYEQSNRVRAQTHALDGSTYSQDYQGNFVYPDDATEIKAHPFFQGLAWDRLHLSRPPWVPVVKGRDDTTYFEEDVPISDVDDGSSFSSEQELLEQEAFEEAVAAEYAKRMNNCQRPGDMDQVQIINDIIIAENAKIDAQEAAGEIKLVSKKGAKIKEKKRPKDRILRDEQVGKQVLDLRKKGAFLGYTYHRPRGVVIEDDRGRSGKQSLSPRSKIPSIV